MANNDVITIDQTCRQYGVSTNDLLELLKALGAVSPHEAERILWMATGVAFAANVKEEKAS